MNVDIPGTKATAVFFFESLNYFLYIFYCLFWTIMIDYFILFIYFLYLYYLYLS